MSFNSELPSSHSSKRGQSGTGLRSLNNQYALTNLVIRLLKQLREDLKWISSVAVASEETVQSDTAFCDKEKGEPKLPSKPPHDSYGCENATPEDDDPEAVVTPYKTPGATGVS